MTTHTFTLSLNETGQFIWLPRHPQEQTAARGNTPIMVDDIIVFKAIDGVHLRFRDKSPFKPQASPAPFEYHSQAGQDLSLTVVGPPDIYPFDCGIRQRDGQVIGLSKKEGDQIPVGP